MTECKSGSDTYLNYKCYEFIKPRFEKYDLGHWGPGYLANAKEILQKRYHDNLEPYEQFFKNITSYLQQDGVFIDADPSIPCSYINYLLNKQYRESYKHSSNTNYEILKDFVKEYLIDKSNRREANSCSAKIEYLEDNKYNRLKSLYYIYDEYIYLVKSITEKKNYTCDILGKIISLYNESIKKYQTDDDKLINKLIELKQLLDENIFSKNQGCYRKITEFSLSDIENKKIQDDERIKREKEEEEERQLAEKQQLEQEKQQLEQEKQRLKQKQLDSEEQQRHLQTALLQPESYEQELEQGPLRQRPEHQVSYEHGQKYQVPYFQATLLPDIQKSELAQSYDSQTFGESEHTGTKMEQSQDQTVLGQMQNAFSSIVHNVEPGPVLGVSGGMGVLFLLFKYTPVGSFFGGRRGRFRQIPRSFNGPFPGAFPDFQDYYGGNVGYGQMNPLAE